MAFGIRRREKRKTKALEKALELEQPESRHVSVERVDVTIMNQVVIDKLQTIYDPEIPVNIYDLGLIYDIAVSEEAHVHIKMTLTAPGCPVAQTFPGTIETEVKSIEAVKDATVELVWDPPWSQDCMTEAAKLQLGLL